MKAMAGQLDPEPRDGQPDRHLVEAGAVLTGDTDALVAGQQQEPAHGDRGRRCRHDDRRREGEQLLGQAGAVADHLLPVVAAQVEAGGEGPAPRGQHHDRLVVPRLHQGCGDLPSIAEDRALTLPSSQRDGRHALVQVVGEEVAHGRKGTSLP